MLEMNKDSTLREYFENNPGRLIHKWEHYFEIYSRHFECFVGRSPKVLEIGGSQGGSLQMWQAYFGAGCQLVGVDVDQRCQQFADEHTAIVIGNQADPAFLRQLVQEHGPFTSSSTTEDTR